MLWRLLVPKVRVACCAQTTAVHVQATWLLSELCDKGNIDRALCGGQFRDEACTPQMVRRDSITLCHRMLQAICNPQTHHGLGFEVQGPFSTLRDAYIDVCHLQLSPVCKQAMR